MSILQPVPDSVLPQLYEPFDIQQFLASIIDRVDQLMFAQGPTLTGTGYSDPAVIRVAPGQITTLYVTGLTSVMPKPVNATTVPLPVTLAGISVTLEQTGIQPTPVPLLSVQQLSVCSNEGATPPSTLTADCMITAITIQIPFELLLPPFTPDVFADLVVTENGNVSKAFRVLPLRDNLHVINVCDTFPSPKVTLAFCTSVVTHANGNLITADNPAQPGEEVVIWAFGLGPTTPTPKAGEISPAPAPTVSFFLYLQFDFRTNATPSRPYINPLIFARFQPRLQFSLA
jgi:hypothetical protein